MVTVVITHKVKDFDRWKPVFDDHETARAEAGEISHTLYREVNNPNYVTITFEWENIEKARKFLSSNDLKEAMIRAGVVGEPRFYYLEQVESKKTYASVNA